MSYELNEASSKTDFKEEFDIQKLKSDESMLITDRDQVEDIHTNGSSTSLFIVVALLGIWISLSRMSGNLFLKEAIISSAIIICLLLFRSIDQKQTPNK